MTNETRNMNRDPLTGEPGAHPVGTGVGAAGGAATGAVIGSLFGPIGTLVGGAIGAAAGGAAGHTVAENIDPTGEAEYWKTTYRSRPYFNDQYDYEADYAPAYLYGNAVRSQYAGREWDDALESDIRQGWEATKAKSRLEWEEAKDAVRDAFDRSDRTYRAYDATDRITPIATTKPSTTSPILVTKAIIGRRIAMALLCAPSRKDESGMIASKPIWNAVGLKPKGHRRWHGTMPGMR